MMNAERFKMCGKNGPPYLLIFVTLLLVLIASQPAHAEPAPPKLVVNHDTQQCAEIFGGDECMDCFPPEGWEVLGWAYQAECPAGYSFTEVEETCTGFKDSFCCTEGHSGAAGDCEDMVINKRDFQCAFVDDINACNLPEPWLAKPADLEVGNWECPGRYDWVDQLDCQAESSAPDGDDSESGSGGPPLICGSTALGIFLLPIALIIFVQKRERSSRQ